MLEKARHLATWDQTVALLWFEDEEVPAPPSNRKEREDEEFGLAELDGILRWPGRRKRKSPWPPHVALQAARCATIARLLRSVLLDGARWACSAETWSSSSRKSLGRRKRLATGEQSAVRLWQSPELLDFDHARGGR